MGKASCAEVPSEAQWQALLAANAAPLPVFQDDSQGSVWTAFGAGHDDLLIYDRTGRVFAWLPSPSTVHNTRVAAPLRAIEQDLLTAEGFASVRNVLLLAAAASPGRCAAADARDGCTWALPVGLLLGLLIAMIGVLGVRVWRGRGGARAPRLALHDEAVEAGVSTTEAAAFSVATTGARESAF